MLDWVTGAVESARVAKEIGNALVTLRDDALIKERVFELNNTLMDLQQRLLEAQQNQFDLQRQVFALEQQVEQAARAQDVKARYKLATFANGVRVYMLRPELRESDEDQYFCTQCFDGNGKTITMQEIRQRRTLFCPTCKTTFYYGGELKSD